MNLILRLPKIISTHFTQYLKIQPIRVSFKTTTNVSSKFKLTHTHTEKSRKTHGEVRVSERLTVERERERGSGDYLENSSDFFIILREVEA